MKLLKLTQLESGLDTYINPYEIVAVNTLVRMRKVEDIVVGEDNRVIITSLTLTNNTTLVVREDPAAVAEAVERYTTEPKRAHPSEFGAP